MGLGIENNYSCEIFNLGNNHCEDLMDMVNHIAKTLIKTQKSTLWISNPGMFQNFCRYRSC